MTHAEKIRLAYAREVLILRETSQALDGAIAAVTDLATEFRAGVTRLERIAQADENVDEKIDALDRLMRRGKYANSKPLVDMTMDELARYFGGA